MGDKRLLRRQEAIPRPADKMDVGVGAHVTWCVRARRPSVVVRLVHNWTQAGQAELFSYVNEGPPADAHLGHPLGWWGCGGERAALNASRHLSAGPVPRPPPLRSLCGAVCGAGAATAVHHRPRLLLQSAAPVMRAPGNAPLPRQRRAALPITLLLYSAPINNILYRTCVSTHERTRERSAFVGPAAIFYFVPFSSLGSIKNIT